MLKKLPLLFLLLLVALPVYGQNALTTASCTVRATIENISVTCPYTGDDNENATAIIQFRASGAMSWINAYTPLIDRRYTINSITNTRSREARGDIVGKSSSPTSPLIPNTLYEVQTTWTDPDGVSGTNPRLDTVTTYPETPSIGTGTCAATDNTSLLACIAAADSTHAHITVAAGTYAPYTVNHGGTSNAYVQLDFADGALCEFTTGASTYCINITANYVWLKHPQFGQTYHTGIRIGATGTYITDSYIPQVSSGCVDSVSLAQNDAGILDNSGNEHFVVGGTIASTTLSTSTCTTTTIPNGNPADGIHITVGTRHTLVYKNISFSGGFRDCTGGDGTSNKTENVDYLGLTLSQCKDDGIDDKGEVVHHRVADNTCITGITISVSGVPTNFGVTCIAPLMNVTTAALPLGPNYIHHNYFYPTNQAAAGYFVKAGGGQVYYFNNTGDGTRKGTTSAGGRWDAVAFIGNFGTPSGSPGYSQWKSLNNIYYTGGTTINPASPSLTDGLGVVTSIGEYDYDLIYRTGSGTYLKWQSGGTTTNINNIAGFQNCVGPSVAPCQEAHGISTAPGITWSVDSVGSITCPGSLACDAGTIIPNFNSLDSAWPYSGTAPDIGAYEYGSSTPPTPGGGGAVTASSVTSTTATISVTAATDPVTPQADLEYLYCLSTSNTVTTVAGCKASVVQAYLANTVSYGASGLSPLTRYYTNVVVRNGALLEVAYNGTNFTTSCGASKIVFTSQPLSASIGGSLGSVIVSVENSANTICTDSTASITIANSGGTCTGMTLTGTKTGNAITGSFLTSNLAETVVGGQCTLSATSSGLTGATSDSFTVFSPTGIGAGRLKLGR